MGPQSTHTKQKRQPRYAPGTSRKTRSAVTLLAQVADIERGTRIRERREELHLTQPAVVDLIEKAAWQLPRDHDLHPDKAGKAPVSLRGYQTYEQGGGIIWEKAKLLAQVLQMDVQTLMSGPSDDADGRLRQVDTPELLTVLNGENQFAQALDRFSDAIEKQNGLLEGLGEILERIERKLGQDEQSADRIEAATESLGGAAAQLDAAVQTTIRELESSTPSTPAKAPKTAPKRSRPASN